MTSAKPDALIRVRQLDTTVEVHATAASTTALAVYGPDQVGPGKRVSLHFELALESGELIDSCFGKAPASFVVGDGSLLPAFEQALFGLKAGESLSCTLPPERAFGVFNEDNVQQFPRYRFPADLLLSEGLMMDFADTAGPTQAGVVRSFDSSNVHVDFNHPLAGRQIGFKALITAVEPMLE